MSAHAEIFVDDHSTAELAVMKSTSPVGVLYRHAFHLGDRPALVSDDLTLTYSELLVQVRALAGSLRDRGVGVGDRIAILSGNGSAFVVAVLAAFYRGALIVPINFRLTAPEIAYIVSDASPRVVSADSAHIDTARAAVDSTELADVDVLLADDTAELPHSEGRLPAPHSPDSEDDMAIMYTSGTTGSPKEAVLSYGNLASTLARMAATWRYEIGEDTVLVSSPLFHISAYVATLGGLANGATCVIAPSGGFSAADTLDRLEAHGVTQTFMVPAQWALIAEEQIARPREIRLKIYNWGAAPATERLLTTLSDLFPAARTQAAFGQTETTASGVSLEHEHSIAKLGSVGLPAPGFAVRIVDHDMEDVPVGEVGEIVYRGPGVMSRYWNNEAATEAAFAGGWFHSGDLVRQDEDGFIYVVDRLKDMIFSGGENIYCAELENVLAWHPKVSEVAVIGRPDEKWGEIPVAVVVPSDDGAPTLDELRDFCDGRLARYKHPRALEVCEELPRSGTGKVKKVDLRAMLG